MSFTPNDSIKFVLPEGAQEIHASDGDKSIDIFERGWSIPGRFGIPKISDDIDQIMVEAFKQGILFKEPVDGRDFSIYMINVVDVNRNTVVKVPLSHFTVVKTVGLKLTDFEKSLASTHLRKELIFALQDGEFHTEDDFHGTGKSRFFRLYR